LVSPNADRIATDDLLGPTPSGVGLVRGVVLYISVASHSLVPNEIHVFYGGHRPVRFPDVVEIPLARAERHDGLKLS
jgi:hypothetical protein